MGKYGNGDTGWFMHDRFGMFIHWGVYSVPAGIYRGERVVRGDRFGNINPLGEWIMHAAKIPVAEYAEYAKQFNPVKFDADAWVEVRQRNDNKVLSKGTQKAGTTMEVIVPVPVSVVIGNAEKVHAEFDGKSLGMRVMSGTGIAKLNLP